MHTKMYVYLNKYQSQSDAHFMFHKGLNLKFTQLKMSFYETQMLIIYENHRHFQYR
jgi:hypothetical protein